eukprot:TRINITY_DN68116_c10_g1_i7.p2 TRINITY_DN68116_c10_g1~~TRINITY_DN68116_c10_g1_i7.p2  ORF type:complete len:114 (+),score=8.88 TRINITY_DN68116_c10_g1_i7:515-856(+)
MSKNHPRNKTTPNPPKPVHGYYEFQCGEATYELRGVFSQQFDDPDWSMEAHVQMVAPVLAPGCKVEIIGLQSERAKHLNGKAAEVIAPLDYEDRYEVKTLDGITCKPRISNII